MTSRGNQGPQGLCGPWQVYEGDRQSSATSLVCPHDLERPGTFILQREKNWPIPPHKDRVTSHSMCLRPESPSPLSTALSQTGQGPDEGSGFTSLSVLDGTKTCVITSLHLTDSQTRIPPGTNLGNA